MVLQIAGFSSFLCLNNIPLHIHVIDLYIYLIFFIHSSRHLGCFPVLAIINSAAMNIRCRYIFKIVILFPLCQSWGVGKWGDVGQRVQACNCKMNKFWGCNV